MGCYRRFELTTSTCNCRREGGFWCLQSGLIRDTTLRTWVSGARSYEKLYFLHLQRSIRPRRVFFWTWRPLKLKELQSFETSRTGDPVTSRHSARNSFSGLCAHMKFTRLHVINRKPHRRDRVTSNASYRQTCLPPSRSPNKNSVASNVHIRQARQRRGRLAPYGFIDSRVSDLRNTNSPAAVDHNAKGKLQPWLRNRRVKCTPTQRAYAWRSAYSS